MDDVNVEPTKLSKINSAGLINLRIHEIWIEVNKFAIRGDYLKWNYSLDRVWCELGGDVKRTVKNSKGDEKASKEFKEFEGLDAEVSKKLAGIKPKKGFVQYSREDLLQMSGVYKTLIKKEFFLRRLMNKQGKGTAYQEASDWD